MDDEVAPSCPISYSQEPSNPRGTAPVKLPSIPIATDLPSLIRAVNIIRDILRSLTTSLTVNNFYFGKNIPSKQYGKKSYLMSDYDSDWYQVGIDNKEGVIYNKSKTKTDTEQKAFVERMDAVEFRNNARDNDQSFFWRYPKPLDGEDRGDPVFQEDFFERIVNVKWKTETPPQYIVSWFYTVTAGGTAEGDEYEYFCDPWTPEPENAVGIFHPSTGGFWEPPKIFPNPFTFTHNMIVRGVPTGSGSGSTSDHWLVHPGVYPDSLSTEPRESIDIRVLGWTMLETKCWGSRPYPPTSLQAYWSAICRLALRGLGQFGLFGTPGNDFIQIGTMTVSAAGITATTKDGKPLTKRKTTMNYVGNAYAGTVRVEFYDPDNPPDDL